MFVLKKTQNDHDFIDYGIPIIPNKPDLRSSYKRCHEYFNPIPQDFDCRVKYPLNKRLLETDIAIKEEKLSVYQKDYKQIKKQEDIEVSYGRSRHIHDVNYNKWIQEQLDKKPPPSVKPRASETKDSFQGIPWEPGYRDIIPPAISAICPIVGPARPIQPTIPPEKDGYWKHLDNYMTHSQLTYKPYTEEEMLGSRKDLPTTYNINGTYPKSQYVLGDRLTGNPEIYDKLIMCPQYPSKNLSRAWKRIPHRGQQSEYNGSFTSHTRSDLFPYIYDNGVKLPTVPSNEPGPWQVFAPPGMYCTEYHHIGTKYPIRSIIDQLRPEDIRYPRKSLKCAECIPDNPYK